MDNLEITPTIPPRDHYKKMYDAQMMITLAIANENKALRIALHDAIRRPMGVVPASADEFYSVEEADRAEKRRVAR